MEKLRIIVGGFIGLFPTGGATWDYIQYPVGFRLLGQDVYYIEDTNLFPVYQQNGKQWDDASDCVAYLKSTMEFFGLADKWAYRDVATGRCFGMSLHKVKEICATADLFINISCSTFMRDEYIKIPKRILIDSDPMFTQIQVKNEVDGETKTSTKDLIQNHNFLFSFGENIGSSDCRIPTFDLNWIRTRQPICLHLWDGNSTTSNLSFTSIMNWSARKKLDYAEEQWGQKDIEFKRFLDLPIRIPEVKFDVVINPPLNPESEFNIARIKSLRWNVLDPKKTVPDFKAYTKFIKASLAEFSVAKETYVKSKSGWFSCRSACYLASGKPVVTQETGWSKFIPSGKGVIAFNTIESAVESIQNVVSNLTYHSKAARQIAEEYFDSNKVLSQILQTVGY